MKQLLLFWCCCCSLLVPSYAQKIKVTIQLTEKDKSPVAGATVKLTDRADSTLFRYQTTDAEGAAAFEGTAPGLYWMDATYIGMAPLRKGVQVSETQYRFQFTLQDDATALKEVTIRAKKPLMRQEDDKTIVDPEPIAGSSTSVYEIMEKTPGLFLDQDGNIYLNSATPATVYINGREQRMSATDLSSLLKSLPPNSIEKIEILRTPSARFDAGGSGGIVNIVLKKGVKLGRTGSVNAGANQGRFGNQNIGISMNNSNDTRTSYWNLSANRRNSYELLVTNRLLSQDTVLRQEAYSLYPGYSGYFGYGLNFEPNQKWQFSLDGRSNYGRNQSEIETNNGIQRISDAAGIGQNFNETLNDGYSFSLNQGGEIKRKLDTLGSEWTADGAYNFFQNHNDQDFDLLFEQPSAPTLGGRGDINSRRHFFNLRTDLKYKFPYEITVETGLKTAIQRFENQTVFSLVQNGVESPDPFRTNAFQYTDAIHAAYLQASKGWRGFILKAGARLENTNMNGRQTVPADTSFDIHRTDLFPYVYLSRKFFKIATYELRGYLVYRKSITRPSYGYLNPFPRFLDQYLYESGNPALRPQFTENYEFNISFQDQPIFALGRNYTRDIFSNVIYQDPRFPEVAYRTYDNLGANREDYFRITGALPPGGVYFFVLSAQYNYLQYNGIYENQPLTFGRGSWNFFTYHQLKLGDRSMLSLNAFLRVNGLAQFYELSNFGALSLNINRQFLDRKLTVTLSANDVFFTNRNQFTIDQGNISAWGDRRSDTRRVGVNVRYNFGIRKKEERGGGFKGFPGEEEQ